MLKILETLFPKRIDFQTKNEKDKLLFFRKNHYAVLILHFSMQNVESKISLNKSFTLCTIDSLKNQPWSSILTWWGLWVAENPDSIKLILDFIYSTNADWGLKVEETLNSVNLIFYFPPSAFRKCRL